MSNEITVVINPGQGLAGPQGPTGPAGSTAPLLSDLKAAATTLGRVPVFGRTALQDGYEGGFIWRTGNFTTQAASDPAEAIYVPSNSVAVSAGCWVRDSDRILLTWFNPTADVALALERAINYAAGREIKAPWNPAGYVVTRPLVITAKGYNLRGDGPEQGGAGYYALTFPRTVIEYNQATGTAPMVAIAEAATAGDTVIGPFIHRNLIFAVASTQASNLFQFGDPTENPVVGGAPNQKYEQSVQFTECGLIGVNELNTTNFTETIVRSGTILVNLTKAFEARIRLCSFFGGDIQIQHYACDKPLVESCRFLSGVIPINQISNNNFQVQHTVDNCQFEQWGLSAISSTATLSITNSRFDNGSPIGGTGGGIFTLTATATITEASDSLTFSSAMDNILIPDQSVIRLTDTNSMTMDCLVKTVSGTTVTIWGNNTSIPALFAGAGKSVKRIHGMHVLYKSAANVFSHSCTVTNTDHNAGYDVPAFIYASGRGTMKIFGATQSRGSGAELFSTVCGNQIDSGGQYMTNTMTMVACDKLLHGNHPFIKIAGETNIYTASQDADVTSGPVGFRDQERARVLRNWVFTPGWGNTVGSQYIKPFEAHPGENASFTGEMVYAWRLVGDATTPTTMDFGAQTIPSVSSVRIHIRAKASGGTEFRLAYIGNGGSAYRRVLVSGDWKTYTLLIPIPTQWSGSAPSGRALRLAGQASAGDILIAGVVIEEVFSLLEGRQVNYNPPSLAAGARTTTTVSVPGAVLGDFVTGASFSLDPQGVMLRGWISAADTATVEFFNPAGAATVDLGIGDVYARVEKRSADVA